MVKVNILCSDRGWVYDQFIDKFKKYSKHEIVRNQKGEFDVAHYIPYYESPLDPVRPSTAWMSHQETENKYLYNKFINAAKGVDVAISHSKKYASMLRDQYNLTNVMQIIPGVDLNKFKVRKAGSRKENDKLVVGYIGRQYTSSGRKNPALLDYIANMSFVDFRTTGGKLPLKGIPLFYRDSDVVISPALIEGGHGDIEVMASGVPIICFDGVGVSREFDTGVLRAKDEVEFLHILKEMYDTKEYIDKWRQTEVMKKMRAQVEGQTWENFVKAHDDVWSMITNDAWKKTKIKERDSHDRKSRFCRA